MALREYENIHDCCRLLNNHSYWQVYRPDLQRVLFNQALSQGVEVRFSARVVDLIADDGVLFLANGERLTADLFICADGASFH
jgi:2-polyprenyl-6-methoxyphenol hydroxylase-like FAD-dependent oxidoreductase